ncbi:dihydroorotate dehydrogenase electron transfer subunit [Aeoliella mucimassa]|uniref:Dihydroorotate dehydrogenase B (NAD(+)), electron transfer subunit n=1 Tax=Aeoliella mucimassa TaxID=2527972 RepID=A0A518ANF9_9BACT|nr:dihydroorotate dehydrogenase electron transfer subunit [Aeoliella mucimassa]QDU56246.1 Dihydroorotate dehydrogenase B (NAD(+)), electron transfer subunit [Aeoliella mucimassa]
MPFALEANALTVPVVENVQLASRTYRVRFECPQIAETVVPGQFLMLRLTGSGDPLLGRAFAMYDTVDDSEGRPTYVDVVYLVIGKMTSRLSQYQPGQMLDVWGPLGNGFTIPECDHLLMVAGGIGQTPMLALGKEHLGIRGYGSPPRTVSAPDKVTLLYGVRSLDLVAGETDFRSAGIDLRIASDDGSIGHHGFVTELLEQALAESAGQRVQVACCGPEVMMERVAEICQAAETPCLVSLETPMACGIGICFSCVAKVRQEDGTWDYRRTCVEGPVFDGCSIEW